MKTDERVADRIAHLERDIKILKNEVQAVLVDLKDKYLAADNQLAPSGMATSQQVIVLQEPGANAAKSDNESHSGSVKQEAEKGKKRGAGGSIGGGKG